MIYLHSPNNSISQNTVWTISHDVAPISLYSQIFCAAVLTKFARPRIILARTTSFDCQAGHENPTKGGVRMNDQDLGERIVALTPLLFHISYGLLRNEADREDAVQSAIEKAWRKAVLLRDENKLKPWLTRILINECHSLLRRKQREVPVEEMPETGNDETEEPSLLHDAVLSLPNDLRVPIILHYMEGFSVQEIADALRCPKGTVLSRMNRARKHLKLLLTEVNDHDEF